MNAGRAAGRGWRPHGVSECVDSVRGVCILQYQVAARQRHLFLYQHIRLPHPLDVDLVERHEFLHRRLTTVAEFEPAQCLNRASRGTQVTIDGRESLRKRGRTPEDRPHHFKARARDRNKAEEWRSRKERIAATLISHQLLGDLPRRRILRRDLASPGKYRKLQLAGPGEKQMYSLMRSFQRRRVNEPKTYPRHFEREAQRRNPVPWMIVGIGELRQPVQLLTPFRPLVDARIKIDQVHSGGAGGREIHDNVSLTIEPARI